MAWGLHPVSGTWSTSSSQGGFLLDNPPPPKKSQAKWFFLRQRCFKFSANPTLTLGYDVQLCWHCVRRGSALWSILFCNVWFTNIMWGQWYSTVLFTTLQDCEIDLCDLECTRASDELMIVRVKRPRQHSPGKQWRIWCWFYTSQFQLSG